MVELGGEEGGVERRVPRRGVPGDRAERHEQLLGLVEEVRPVFARGVREVHREIAVAEVLDEGSAKVRRVAVVGRHTDPGVRERTPDRRPVRLGGGAGLRVEDDENAPSAGRGLAEVAAGADVPCERDGGGCRGEAEALPGARETRGLAVHGRGRHDLG